MLCELFEGKSKGKAPLITSALSVPPTAPGTQASDPYRTGSSLAAGTKPRRPASTDINEMRQALLTTSSRVRISL